jgi:hypothetical protein
MVLAHHIILTAYGFFLDSIDDILCAIRYVRDNPIRAGMRPQPYRFVQEFDAPALEALPALRLGRG